MVITVPASRPAGGLRKINPNNDIPQLVELLQLVFGTEFEGDGQQVFNNVGRTRNPSFLWRLDSLMAKLASGFIWEVNGRIVGNATIIYTRSRYRYLVANVAIHPEYRRQGIARHLMQAVVKDISGRGGKTLALQVVKGNQAAVDLYESMNFFAIGSMTTWQSSVSRLRTAGDTGESLLQPLPADRWREAYDLDRIALDPRLYWPEPLTVDSYRRGLMSRFSDFINGRKFDTLILYDDKNKINGLVNIFSEWGRTHQISIRIHPRWRGLLERKLLDGAIRRAKFLPRRNVQLIHPANDELMNMLLPIANFNRQRTLTHMRLDIENAVDETKGYKF